MTIERVKQLHRQFPNKKIFYDMINKCFRLIHPLQLYQWQDEEGKWHIRQNVERLVPISNN